MQSRLAITAAVHRHLLLSGGPKQLLAQRLCCSTSSGRTADPAVHAVDPDEVSPTDAIHEEMVRHAHYDHESSTKYHGVDEAYVSPKSPVQSAPKIESNAVGPRPDPIFQQKRQISSKIEDASSCGGIDQSPWPSDGSEADLKEQREDQLGDDVEYFKHHKASPLSEIEIADNRKPMSRATDAVPSKDDNDTGRNYESGRGYNVWRPEQVDTAEDSLRRATEIFRRNAIRGDPDSPHGRVLRELRRENW